LSKTAPLKEFFFIKIDEKENFIYYLASQSVLRNNFREALIIPLLTQYNKHYCPQKCLYLITKVIQLRSIITCPGCGFSKKENMPTD
jgi:hypothetical protein